MIHPNAKKFHISDDTYYAKFILKTHTRNICRSINVLKFRMFFRSQLLRSNTSIGISFWRRNQQNEIISYIFFTRDTFMQFHNLILAHPQQTKAEKVMWQKQLPFRKLYISHILTNEYYRFEICNRIFFFQYFFFASFPSVWTKNSKSSNWLGNIGLILMVVLHMLHRFISLRGSFERKTKQIEPMRLKIVRINRE